MRDVVESIENWAAERNLNQRSGRTQGEVTEDRGLTIGYRDNLERRVTKNSISFWAGELHGGQYGKIHWQGEGQRL